MRFGNGRILVGPIKRPMHRVGGDTMKIAFLAEITFVFDKKPNLAFENVIDLFRLVLMWLGMITGSSSRDHQAALVAIAFADHHLTGAGLAGLSSVVFRNVCTLAV